MSSKFGFSLSGGMVISFLHSVTTHQTHYVDTTGCVLAFEYMLNICSYFVVVTNICFRDYSQSVVY